MLLMEFTCCALVNELPSTPNENGPLQPGVSDTAENTLYPYANLSVPTTTESGPDGPAGQDAVTSVTYSVTSTITAPPTAMLGTCQIGNCTATASVCKPASDHRKLS